MDIAALKKQMDDAKDSIKKNGEKALKTAFKEMFAEHSEIAAVRWRQYTPYFNDGEQCVFGVRDMYVKLTGVGENDESGDYDDGFIYPEDHKIDKWWSAVEDDEIFEIVFGDHCMVTATRDGFEIEEYDHD